MRSHSPSPRCRSMSGQPLRNSAAISRQPMGRPWLDQSPGRALRLFHTSRFRMETRSWRARSRRTQRPLPCPLQSMILVPLVLSRLRLGADELGPTCVRAERVTISRCRGSNCQALSWIPSRGGRCGRSPAPAAAGVWPARVRCCDPPARGVRQAEDTQEGRALAPVRGRTSG